MSVLKFNRLDYVLNSTFVKIQSCRKDITTSMAPEKNRLLYVLQMNSSEVHRCTHIRNFSLICEQLGLLLSWNVERTYFHVFLFFRMNNERNLKTVLLFLNSTIPVKWKIIVPIFSMYYNEIISILYYKFVEIHRLHRLY